MGPVLLLRHDVVANFVVNGSTAFTWSCSVTKDLRQSHCAILIQDPSATALCVTRSLIPAWISSYIHNKMWDEMTYPFPNFNGAAVEVWNWISSFIPHFTGALIHAGIKFKPVLLTHWGRVTHICVGNLTTIGSDNGLSPDRRQAIIWTNAGILLIGPLGTNFNEILLEIYTFSFTKMHLKMSSGKWRPFCLCLNVLKMEILVTFDASMPRNGGKCKHIFQAALTNATKPTVNIQHWQLPVGLLWS